MESSSTCRISVFPNHFLIPNVKRSNGLFSLRQSVDPTCNPKMLGGTGASGCGEVRLHKRASCVAGHFLAVNSRQIVAPRDRWHAPKSTKRGSDDHPVPYRPRNAGRHGRTWLPRSRAV